MRNRMRNRTQHRIRRRVLSVGVRLDVATPVARWVRLADGPDDLAELELPEPASADVESGA